MTDKSMFDILSKFNAASKPITECGMSEGGMDSGVTLRTSSASEMAEILRALAGVEQGHAEPDGDEMPMTLPMALPSPEEEMESYGDEMNNEPEEEFMGMDAVLPSGDDLHRKKDIGAVRVKDPAVKTESIKDRLWAALNEKKENLK